MSKPHFSEDKDEEGYIVTLLIFVVSFFTMYMMDVTLFKASLLALVIFVGIGFVVYTLYKAIMLAIKSYEDKDFFFGLLCILYFFILISLWGLILRNIF
jgi:hypothetical protein